MVARGGLEDGAGLPPVRVLAERGVVEGRGLGGTVIASAEPLRREGTSFSGDVDETYGLTVTHGALGVRIDQRGMDPAAPEALAGVLGLPCAR
jgi:hypothetical protein